MQQKRVMAINDISCFGKCSLTVALPVLSAAGLEACPLPTALLSTHTGGFSDFTFENLDGQMMPITAHWKKLGLEFDAIYSGYLASNEQIEYVSEIIGSFKKESTTVLIDPVMGDNGKLYTGFDTAFAQKMRKLCQKADITVPNITETSYLLEIPFLESYSVENIEDIFKRFAALDIKNAVVTGIPLENGKIGCAFCEKGNIAVLENDRVEGMYHGTGDVFASAFLGAFMKNGDIYKSVALAQKYVYDCILRTKERCGTSHYGIDFEPLIGDFCESLQKL